MERMNYRIVTLVLSLPFIAMSCGGNGELVLFDGSLRGVWVATEPIQCLGNPWQQDWLASHDDDRSAYPRDFESRAEIIRGFFARQGVEVRGVGRKSHQEVICRACSCSAGYMLFVLVHRADVSVMTGFGFREMP